ncbi:hypothetical protein GX408_16180 [bacterium]|nr:hypothetical protein [bacterium]
MASVHCSDQASLPVWLVGRYLPQLNVQRRIDAGLMDLEASMNVNAELAWDPSDSSFSTSSCKAYRLWLRYSTEQLEIRLGLQKINFGSATLLRPLMWFDQVDPRDPLQLTDGVWGLLGRYYFLDNANLWLWLLWPTDQPKTWETESSSPNVPEWGGRVQYPLPRGEIGLSGHVRKVETRAWDAFSREESPEGRIGIDGKWDWILGLWFEGAWIHRGQVHGVAHDQSAWTLGADYTFAIGHGLNALYEHLWVSWNKGVMFFNSARTFSGLSFSYPLSGFDQLAAIFYLDWEQKGVYRFLSWRRQWTHFSLNVMAFRNPAAMMLPNASSGQAAAGWSGTGLQGMVIYHH